MRAPVSRAMSASRRPIDTACSRDSMTHGPAKKSGGSAPPPSPPIAYPGAISIRRTAPDQEISSRTPTGACALRSASAARLSSRAPRCARAARMKSLNRG